MATSGLTCTPSVRALISTSPCQQRQRGGCPCRWQCARLLGLQCQAFSWTALVTGLTICSGRSPRRKPQSSTLPTEPRSLRSTQSCTRPLARKHYCLAMHLGHVCTRRPAQRTVWICCARASSMGFAQSILVLSSGRRIRQRAQLIQRWCTNGLICSRLRQQRTAPSSSKHGLDQRPPRLMARGLAGRLRSGILLLVSL